MKRLLSVVLCLMLVTGFAFAEETVRVREMMLEGMPEEVTETLYQSETGYSIWYPSEYLTPGEQYGRPCFFPVVGGDESGIYFLIVSAEADPADAEALLNEAVGGFEPGAAISEVQWTTTEGGALLGSVQAMTDNVIYRYYLAANDEEVLLITSCFPLEAAEGFGVRFDRMAETISFDTLKTDALYEGDGYSIGYFAGQLEPVKIYSHDGFVPVGDDEESGVSLMIVKSDVASEHADVMLNEAIGGYVGEYMVSWGEEKTLASGMLLRSVSVELEGRIDRFYLIWNADAVYCLTASFPVMSEVDYGMAFDTMAESFELTVQE